MSDRHAITSITFENFRGFERYSLSLKHVNVLVGNNNAGKSTVLAGLRLLAAGLRTANARSPELWPGVGGARRLGYRLPTADLPISLSTIHTDDREVDSTVVTRLSNQSQLTLFFPRDGGAFLFVEREGRIPRSPKEFKRDVPVSITPVPVLGPVEDDEQLVEPATLQRGLATHRAARHFRNYWRANSDSFDEFRALIEETWPGLSVTPPVLEYGVGPACLRMFCTERKMRRELYSVGFGFQVWCQLLTHVLRGRDSTLMLVDEPEIYLHPDLQRRLLVILREAGPDILLATHSAEVISDADPSEVVLVNKARRSAKRLTDERDVQTVLDTIGSVQNVALAQLAKNRRLLFVEGLDFGLIRRFARKLRFNELASGADLTVVPAGGFGNWERVRGMAWGLEQTLGRQLAIGVVLDRDFRPQEELDEITDELSKHCAFVWIHHRKEIENYLLSIGALTRAAERALLDRARRRGMDEARVEVPLRTLLEEITEDSHSHILGQYVAKRQQYSPSGRDKASSAGDAIAWFQERWTSLERRLEIVKGKEVFSKLNERLMKDFQIQLTPVMVVDEMRLDEVAPDMRDLLSALERFRNRATESAEDG